MATRFQGWGFSAVRRRLPHLPAVFSIKLSLPETSPSFVCVSTNRPSPREPRFPPMPDVWLGCRNSCWIDRRMTQIGSNGHSGRAPGQEGGRDDPGQGSRCCRIRCRGPHCSQRLSVSAAHMSQLLVSPMAGPVDPRRQGQALKEADVEPHEPRFKACLFLLCGLRPSTWPLWASVCSPAE